MRTVHNPEWEAVTVEAIKGSKETTYKLRAADGALLGEAIRFGDGFMANVPWIHGSIRNDCASLSECAAWLEAIRAREEKLRIGAV